MNKLERIACEEASTNERENEDEGYVTPIDTGADPGCGPGFDEEESS